jgi:hypothetical protein
VLTKEALQALGRMPLLEQLNEEVNSCMYVQQDDTPAYAKKDSVKTLYTAFCE